MAADFNKPVLTDDYISILEQLRQNYEVLARMFATGTTAANIPVGSVRFDSGKFQSWNGSAWVDVPLSLDGGGTGEQNAAAARVALGTNDAANLTTGVMSADRVPGLDAAKIVSGTLTRDTSGNAATATKWATARTLDIAGRGKSIDGSGNVTWTRSEMGIIGEAQTWQDVSNSRNLGTTYTNGTGRSIMVAVSSVRLVTFDSGLLLYVDGVLIARTDSFSDVDGFFSAIIPSGSTYRVTRTGYETNHLWAELR